MIYTDHEGDYRDVQGMLVDYVGVVSVHLVVAGNVNFLFVMVYAGSDSR